MRVVLNLEKVRYLESIPIANDLHKSLQQQDLSSLPLFKDQQQNDAVLEAHLLQAILVVPKDS